MQISIANIIRGTLIGNTMSVLTRYISRVVNDGGIVEAPQCVETSLNSQGLLQQASLLVVPSGYKGGRLYSQIPTNGNGDLTWTRGSDGFRTNASGLIQRVPWNLLQRSEEFDNAVWSKINTSITANTSATLDPSGGNNADKFIANNNNAAHFVAQTGFTSGVYTFSVYAKAAEESSMSLWLRSASVGATFNLSNGTVSNISVTSATITSVGNGWYRCSVYDSTAGTSGHIYGRNGSGYVGNNVDGFYLFGAQLVEGTTAQTYLPTTDRLNFPRLSYMYGSCPSVLLEPQRTNVVLQSETFDNASWVKVASSVTANTTTSPDGTTNADTFTGDGTSSGKSLLQNGTSTLTNGVAYTTTIYAKKNTNNFIQLVGSTLPYVNVNVWANFDLNNGVVGSVGSSATATIMNVGNGWYRCSMTATAGATSNGNIFIIQLIASATSVRAELNTLSTSVFIWGAQLEAGAYPTTYIPTTTATATRVADSFSRNNIFTNGLITASGGTWFVELKNNIGYTRDSASFGLFIDSASGGITNGFSIRQRGTAGDRLSIQKQVAGTQTFLYLTTTNTTKIAIKWNGTTADIFANGVKVVSATSFTPTAIEFLNASIADVPYFIQQMALYPSPLSDTDCTTITTL